MLCLGIVTVLWVGLAPTATAAPDNYSPPAGVKFNNPYGSAASERAIFRHLVRTINTVKHGQQIRIASWNVRSPGIANALIAANKRGVSVRIVMDRINATAGNPNRDVARLVNELRRYNKKRKADMTSWLRKCISSCRARGGIAHSKFFLFSKVGKKAKNTNVVMYGSNNATDLAATIQWNDLFTMKRNQKVYDEFDQVFKEMAKDSGVRGGSYRRFTAGSFTGIFYPFRGPKAVGDPDLAVLNKIRCTGATRGAGRNGRTVIRMAQTAMHGPRGIKLARKLASMRRSGCDIRVVYAMFGNEVVKILRGSGVGLTHLAWDRDLNGIYDRYVHMKSMAVSGVYDGKTNARVTFNGSANWTGVALASDEVVGVLPRRAITDRYIRWINYMFTHRPASWTTDTQATGAARKSPLSFDQMTGDAVTERARRRGVDPYALIKQEF